MPSGLNMDNEHINVSSCSHGRFLEKTSFMLRISRCPCKISCENKKERQKQSFPVHTCCTLAASPVPTTLKDKCPSTQHRQQTDRQTADRLSDPPKWHFLVYYDQTIVWEKAIVRGCEASALDQSDKRKNITGVGYCAAVMRKIRNISDVFYFGERSISVCANTMLSSCALSAIYPSIYPYRPRSHYMFVTWLISEDEGKLQEQRT